VGRRMARELTDAVAVFRTGHSRKDYVRARRTHRF
jgi:hypothetical protein